MNTLLAPLFRHTVGFDHLDRMLSNLTLEQSSGFPPYNIEVTGKDTYKVILAVAGFSPEELTVTAEGNSLVVKGERAETEPGTFLYRGIAARSFERRFELADHVRVVDAGLDNGLLTISLAREVPEALKPRVIPVARALPAA